MIFYDNHDMDRFYHTIGENLAKFKMATTLLLTTRGVPQVYYGTEILMRKFGSHGLLREDFPGGWQGDDRNAFEESGRTAEENEVFNYMKKILNWRKGSEAIKNGKLKHFVPYSWVPPSKNIYVYSRQTENETVLVILNNNDKESTLDMSRFKEVIGDSSSASDIISGEQLTDLSTIILEAYASKILILNKKALTK